MKQMLGVNRDASKLLDFLQAAGDELDYQLCE
jgi:hypothetical protein